MEMGKLKKMFSIALSCVFLLTLCNVESVFAADFTAPEGKLLTSLKQYSIAPGVKEQHITLVDSQGDNQVQGYAATVDLTKKPESLPAIRITIPVESGECKPFEIRRPQ